MIEQLRYNKAQLRTMWLKAHTTVDVWGRGTGKSTIIGEDVNLINRIMPRGIGLITGQTYGQLLTRTLPATFKHLEKLGYIKDVHYVINKKPPDYFKSPHEKLLKYENVITFLNGTSYLLASQDRAGSSRGPSVDFEIVDEALTINKKRYDEESSATNRGNEEHFGFLSKNPVFFHHGAHYVSSMPFDKAGEWLLRFGDYYQEEAGINIFEEWNKIIRLQLELLDITNPTEFKDLWNQILREKKKIAPFVSKDNILFTLSNAFDNIENLGLSYIKKQRQKMTDLVFMIEIMNWIPDKVEDCYYQLAPKHIYNNFINDSHAVDVANNTGYDFNRLSIDNSLYDADCNKNQPLEAVFDWGSNISFLLVVQENSQVEQYPTINFIKEFYSKPEEGRVMIDDLIDDFCRYYEHHQKKTVIYYRDKYGDERQANSSLTYNEQAIKRLRANGWRVVLEEYKGKEPPHHEKYLLWANTLKETGEYPIVRINGDNCKNFVIAANNTRVQEKNNRFEKDKRSERKDSGTPPERATHSTDAADKIIYVKYINKRSGAFIPIRS